MSNETILATKQEFFFTKVVPVQSITDIILLGFSLILLPGMFISHYTIIYFFVNNFFSNVYISVNTIFECSYLSFGWEIGHPLSIYVTRGMDGGHPKGGEGYHASCVRTHLYYLFPCFYHMVSCCICRNLHLRHVIEYICATVFKIIFLQQPYGRKSYPKCVHILTREKGGWKIVEKKIRTY